MQKTLHNILLCCWAILIIPRVDAQQHSFDYWQNHLFELTSTNPEAVHLKCDSLILYSEIITDNQKALLYFIKSDADYYLSDIRSSTNNINQALKLVDQSFPKEELAEMQNAQGQNYDYLGLQDSAIYFYYKSLDTAKEINDSLGISNVYYNLALIDIQRNELSGALENLDTSIVIGHELKDSSALSHSYRLMGTLQSQYYMNSKALSTFHDALKFVTKEDPEQGCVTLLSIAHEWIELNQMDSAQYYIQEAENCFNQLIKPPHISYLHKAKGDYYKQINDTANAIYHYDIGLKISHDKGDFQEKMNYQTSKMYLAANQHSIEEFEYLITQLKQSNKHDLLRIAHRAFAEKLHSKGLYKDAYENMLIADKYDKEWSKTKNSRILQGQIVAQQIYQKDQELKLTRAELRSKQAKWLSIGLIILSSLIALMGFVYYRNKKAKLQATNDRIKKEAQLQRELSEIESQALRAQMNPHFLFNALNSIKGYIVNKQEKEAASYISKFSKLIRSTLENSMYKSIPLAEEIRTLELYIQLEKSRFRDNFNYKISLDKELDTDYIQIPPVLLQPFVENAIWHGFKNNTKPNELLIEIDNVDEQLEITITDNGVGRQATAEKKHMNKKSHGVSITKKRIFNFSEDHDANRLKVVDLFDQEHIASGTQIIITIPIKHAAQ